MTEAEWLASSKPRELLGTRGRFTERQLILFGCACCRYRWERFTDASCQQAVMTAELFADGASDESTLQAVRESVEANYPNLHWTYIGIDTYLPRAAWLAAFGTTAAQEFEGRHALGGDAFDDMLAALKSELSELVASAEDDVGNDVIGELEQATHAAFVRDIFGNPFRPVMFALKWRTDTALAIARQMYESRDFNAMPILADALQDAGCDSADVLNHCRGDGPHVRGCWVVDLVLRKE